MNAHVVLLGADEGEIKLPNMVDRMGHMDDESAEEEPLEAFADVDYEEFEGENAASDSKSPWGEGSK